MQFPAEKKYLPPLVFLALCSALLVLARLHTFHEPLHGDLMLYAVSAREWLLGRGLYSDLFDVKPPGIFWAYAGAQALFGYTRLSVFALNAGCAVLTLLAVFGAGRLKSGRLSTGLWAGLFWTLISGDIALWANQPNTEAFINLFAAAGFAILLGRKAGEDLSTAGAVALGALFAAASFFKQNSLAILFLFLAGHILRARLGAPGRRTPLKGALTACGVVLFCWLFFLGYTRLTGQWEALLDLLNYQRAYVSSTGGILGSLLRSFGPALLPEGGWLPVCHLILLFIFGAEYLLMDRTGKTDGKRLLLVSYLLGVQAAVALPGWFYTQYYQLWLPFLAIAGGWAVESIELSPFKYARRLSFAAGAAIIIILLAAELPPFRLPAEDWSRKKFGDEFIVTDKLGLDLKELLGPGGSFYAWGTQPGLYFTSGLRPPSGLFYNTPLLSGPLREKLSGRLLSALTVTPPELFIALRPELEAGRRGGTVHPVLSWALARYREFDWEGHRGSFAFFARSGGALEKRILSGKLPASFQKPLKKS